ncbi:DUF5301 domain-containing protein [Clostridium saccharoperbutylacetonicum]
MRTILKKLSIILGLIFVFVLFFEIKVFNNTKIRLFESVDTDNISEISIFNPGASFNTDNKNDILEIMNYLKNIKLSESSNKMLPNTTPDAQIALEDKDGKTISSIAIYGNVAVLYPDDTKWYTISSAIYSDLENLDKRHKNN